MSILSKSGLIDFEGLCCKTGSFSEAVSGAPVLRSDPLLRIDEQRFGYCFGSEVCAKRGEGLKILPGG